MKKAVKTFRHAEAHREAPALPVEAGRMSYVKSLLSEFGVELPEHPSAKVLTDALIEALREAQGERQELLDDLTPHCGICAYEDREMHESPCCRCEGCSEFVWHGWPDCLIEEVPDEI